MVDDLLALPRSPLVVAEGSTLPAAAVQDRSRAVWLLPTPEFQQARLEERRLASGERERFLLLAKTIEREARDHDVPTLVVNGRDGIEAGRPSNGASKAHLPEGPTATTVAERRALLREANEAVVAQVRGYYAHPWAEGDAS